MTISSITTDMRRRTTPELRRRDTRDWGVQLIRTRTRRRTCRRELPPAELNALTPTGFLTLRAAFPDATGDLCPQHGYDLPNLPIDADGRTDWLLEAVLNAERGAHGTTHNDSASPVHLLVDPWAETVSPTTGRLTVNDPRIPGPPETATPKPHGARPAYVAAHLLAKGLRAMLAAAEDVYSHMHVPTGKTHGPVVFEAPGRKAVVMELVDRT